MNPYSGWLTGNESCMKINEWARIQTLSILRNLILYILAILFPIFLVLLAWNQISNVNSIFAASKKNLIVSMQTGDVITLEKTMSIYTQDPSLTGYELYDRDGHLVKQARVSSEHVFIFPKQFTLISSDNLNWGSIKLYWTIKWKVFLYFTFFVMGIVGVVAFVVHRSWRKFSRILIDTFEQLPESLENKSAPALVNQIEEFKSLFAKLKRSRQQEHENQKLLSQREKEKALIELSQKVAHDIRSPLSAISLISEVIESNTEYKQLFKDSIQRINEICENLLKERRRSQSFRKMSIHQAIEQIVTEKKMVMPDLDIQFQNSSETADLAIPDVEFKDVLSNLIQNSIEAMDKNKKIIQIQSSMREKDLSICIRDNGRGVPQDIIEELGQNPISFGKGSSGNGLGFFNAKKWALSHGGDIEIQSSLRIGTEVKLNFLTY